MVMLLRTTGKLGSVSTVSVTFVGRASSSLSVLPPPLIELTV